MGVNRYLLATDRHTVMQARGLHHRVVRLVNVRPYGGDPNLLNFQASWHAIHFLLTGYRQGGSEPWCWVVSGGELLVDPPFRDARFLTALQVQRLSWALSKVAASELRSRFDPIAMTEAVVYPAGRAAPDFWFRECVPDWFLTKYEELRVFYSTASEQRQFVVQWT